MRGLLILLRKKLCKAGALNLPLSTPLQVRDHLHYNFVEYEITYPNFVGEEAEVQKGYVARKPCEIVTKPGL